MDYIDARKDQFGVGAICTQPQVAPSTYYAAGDAFAHWCDALSASLREHGAAAPAAESLALLIVTSVEGSVAICRAEGSTRALDLVAQTIENPVESTLPPGAAPAEG